MKSPKLLFSIILVFLIYPNDSGAQQNLQNPLTGFYAHAAEQGDTDAQYGLGVIYAQGLGVASDHAEAVKWFRKAAEKGHTLAQFSMGEAYSRGAGVPLNHTEAAQWFRKAAEEGNSAAQVSLGTMYIQGDGVPQNPAEAEKLFRKAAEKGNHTAQSLLGTMNAEGLGIAADYIEAYMWLTLSIAGSIEKQDAFAQKVRDMRDLLTQKMTPQQIEEAKRRAEEWKPLPKPVGGRVQESRLLWKVDPIYPEAAKRQRIAGRVVMILTVNEKGNVTDIRVSSGHPMLIEAAVNAVKQWKYIPTILSGEPVPVIITATTFFNLKY